YPRSGPFRWTGSRVDGAHLRGTGRPGSESNPGVMSCAAETGRGRAGAAVIRAGSGTGRKCEDPDVRERPLACCQHDQRVVSHAAEPTLCSGLRTRPSMFRSEGPAPEAVTEPPHGLHPIPVISQLPAEPLYVHVDRPRGDVGSDFPDDLQQLAS